MHQMKENRPKSDLKPIKTDAEYWEQKIASMKTATTELQAGSAFAPKAYRCQRCQDKGWLDVAGNTVVRCPSCTAVPVEDDPWPPSVPFEFKGAMIANYEAMPGNATAIRYLHKFFEVERGDLYLYGAVGTGKSRLAATLLNEFFRKTKTGIFVRVGRFLRDLQPGGNPDAQEAIYAAVRSQPLIVMDDIGAERDVATDFTRRTVFDLYEERSDRGLRTIWTSNKNLTQLSAQLDDERLVSRLAQRAEIVELTTVDQRLLRRRGLGK